jgi:hypothetical protein
MSGTEPNGWELKRSIDQLRADTVKRLDDNRAEAKEDQAEVKATLSSLGDKLDGLGSIYVTRTEFDGLVGQVKDVKAAGAKRSERSLTIWIAIGGTACASVTAIATTVIGILAQK